VDLRHLILQQPQVEHEARDLILWEPHSKERKIEPSLFEEIIEARCYNERVGVERKDKPHSASIERINGNEISQEIFLMVQINFEHMEFYICS